MTSTSFLSLSLYQLLLLSSTKLHVWWTSREVDRGFSKIQILNFFFRRHEWRRCVGFDFQWMLVGRFRCLAHRFLTRRSLDLFFSLSIFLSILRCKYSRTSGQLAKDRGECLGNLWVSESLFRPHSPMISSTRFGVLILSLHIHKNLDFLQGVLTLIPTFSLSPRWLASFHQLE